MLFKAISTMLCIYDCRCFAVYLIRLRGTQIWFLPPWVWGSWVSIRASSKNAPFWLDRPVQAERRCST